MNVRFDILAWLLVPLAVTLLALLWVAWRGRSRSPEDAHEGMAHLLRFREAMAKPLPTRSGRPADGDRSTTGAGSERGAA